MEHGREPVFFSCLPFSHSTLTIKPYLPSHGCVPTTHSLRTSLQNFPREFPQTPTVADACSHHAMVSQQVHPTDGKWCSSGSLWHLTACSPQWERCKQAGDNQTGQNSKSPAAILRHHTTFVPVPLFPVTMEGFSDGCLQTKKDRLASREWVSARSMDEELDGNVVEQEPARGMLNNCWSTAFFSSGPLIRLSNNI